MEIETSDRLKNYIIFSYIEKLVMDLCSVFTDDEPLNSYYHMLMNSNRITETEDFVAGFKRALDGTKKAIYAPGVYINIPKFLSKDDANKAIIQEYLDTIKKLYEDINNCNELKYMHQSSKDLSNQRLDGITDDHKKPQMIQMLTEKITKAISEKMNDTNVDKTLAIKLFLLGIYDYPFEKEFGEDAQHFKNIIDVIINTPINDLKNKRMLIAREVLSIKSIPITDIFSSLENKRA